MRKVKDECRVLGIDDTSFDKFTDKKAKAIGIVYRGGNFMDGCLSTDVEVDGEDATDKISKMLLNSRFAKQIRCIMLDGIAVAGFNVIDVQKLYETTSIPVIIIIRTYPDIKRTYKALENLGMNKKIEMLQKAGDVKELSISEGKIYFQNTGLEEDKARELIKKTSTHSMIPEPIRVAHLIGQGISMGESRGSA